MHEQESLDLRAGSPCAYGYNVVPYCRDVREIGPIMIDIPLDAEDWSEAVGMARGQTKGSVGAPKGNIE